MPSTPELGPDGHMLRYVAAAGALLRQVHPDHDGRVPLRLMLACRTPARWELWGFDPPALVARRQLYEPASPVERALFEAGRGLVGAIVGKLELEQRIWLLRRLGGRDEELGETQPHLRLALDVVGASYGCVLSVWLSAASSATIASLGGVLARPEAAAA